VEKKNLPPEKRTKSGKARAGRQRDRKRGGAPAPKERSSASLLVAWVLALILLASLIYFAGKSRRLPPLSDDLATDTTGARSETKVAPLNTSKVVIVIDDFGPDAGIAQKFASLPFPVTISVLPFQAHSRDIAQMAHQAGREVILHLPMEPLDRGADPGRGALLLSMSGKQIRQSIEAALDTSPFFEGVNNHMGSRITQDVRIMKTLMSELKRRDLFFIDSMTTSDSVGWKMAQELSVPTLKRDIFLDDNPSQDAINAQIAKLVEIAKTQGMALAIGHPHAETLRSLQAAAARLGEEGIEPVTARSLIKGELKEGRKVNTGG
jgi:hypothetical protein